MKKIAQTDAIFDEVHKINQQADADETMLRISLDAKAPLRMGLFSRGGLNRVVVKGLDHEVGFVQAIMTSRARLRK